LEGNSWRKGLGPRNSERIGKANIKNLIWRADMDELLRDLLRGVVVRSLRWSLVHPMTNGVGKCDGMEHLETLDDVACVLRIWSQPRQAILDAAEEVEACIARCDALADKLRNFEKWVRRRQGKGGLRDFNVPTQVLVSTSIPRLNPELRNPALEFPTVPYRDKRIPLYCLVDMLGNEKTTELLKDTVFEKSSYLVVKQGRLTAGAQMALMRLQGYLT
jgi:hypothetical protein